MGVNVNHETLKLHHDSVPVIPQHNRQPIANDHTLQTLIGGSASSAAMPVAIGLKSNFWIVESAVVVLQGEGDACFIVLLRDRHYGSKHHN